MCAAREVGEVGRAAVQSAQSRVTACTTPPVGRLTPKFDMVRWPFRNIDMQHEAH